MKIRRVMRERYTGPLWRMSSAVPIDRGPVATGACEALIRIGEWTTYYEICGRRARSRLTGTTYPWGDEKDQIVTSINACGIHDRPRYGLLITGPRS